MQVQIQIICSGNEDEKTSKHHSLKMKKEIYQSILFYFSICPQTEPNMKFFTDV